MNDSDLAELNRLKARVLDSMLRYMNRTRENFSPGYCEDDIARCESILGEFLRDLQSTGPTEENIMRCVKKAVLDLNQLNEQTNHCLIETGQREDICSYIDFAVRKAGLDTSGRDITEAWREW
jgi:hypothetical protein